jgi:hypothetical protein
VGGPPVDCTQPQPHVDRGGRRDEIHLAEDDAVGEGELRERLAAPRAAGRGPMVQAAEHVLRVGEGDHALQRTACSM